MNMVTTALYNPVSPEGAPIAVRTFLLCRASRITIMSVRRTLSESEIEKYERPKLTATESQMLLFGCEDRCMSMIPVAVSTTSLAQSAADVWKNRARTQGTEIHNDPGVHGMDNVAAIELEEQPM